VAGGAKEFSTWDNILQFSDTYGNLIGAISLVATLGGFVWTLLKLYHDRKEMSEAQKAIKDAQDKASIAISEAKDDIAATNASVQEIRSNLFRFDAVAEIASAIAIINEVRNMQLQDPDHWLLIIDRYTSVRQSLIQVKPLASLLGAPQETVIQGVIAQISTAQESIERAIIAKSNPKNMASINRILSEQTDSLTRLLHELKEIDWSKHGESSGFRDEAS